MAFTREQAADSVLLLQQSESTLAELATRLRKAVADWRPKQPDAKLALNFALPSGVIVKSTGGLSLRQLAVIIAAIELRGQVGIEMVLQTLKMIASGSAIKGHIYKPFQPTTAIRI